MKGFSGADPDALDDLAGAMGKEGSRLHTVEAVTNSLVNGAVWMGADADQFAADWRGRMRPQLLAAQQLLEEMDRELRVHASEQRAASDGSRGGSFAFVGESGSKTGAWPGPQPAHAGLLLFALGGVKVADSFDTLLSMGKATKHLGFLMNSTGLRHSIGLRSIPAMAWAKSVGGFGKVGPLGYALAAADFGLNWAHYGLTDEHTIESGVMGGGGILATAVAGPLGGITWTVSTQGTKMLLEATGADQAMSGAISSRAYGDPQPIPERSREWWQNASPQQAEAETEVAAERSRLAQENMERAKKPWLMGWDFAIGRSTR